MQRAQAEEAQRHQEDAQHEDPQFPIATSVDEGDNQARKHDERFDDDGSVRPGKEQATHGVEVERRVRRT